MRVFLLGVLVAVLILAKIFYGLDFGIISFYITLDDVNVISNSIDVFVWINSTLCFCLGWEGSDILDKKIFNRKKKNNEGQ